METLQIEIVNPKAKKLLEDLEDLKLITISKSSSSKKQFKTLLAKLRSNAATAPSLEEITKEVEIVRSLHHENK